MNRINVALYSLLVLMAAKGVGHAQNQIVIYKSTSTLPWSEYSCYRPASPAPIPQASRVGTYTETKYVVYDGTAQQMRNIIYYAFVFNGVTVKQYATHSVVDVGVAGDPLAEQFIHSNAVNTWFHCLNRGNHFVDPSDSNEDGIDDNYFETWHMNLAGTAKPYLVVTGMTFPRVATTLSGRQIYSFNDVISSSNPAEPHHSTVYSENGTITWTIDAVNTKKANTGLPLFSLDGSTPYTNRTLDYGVRVAQLVLEALGYDSTDEIPVN